jgi:transcriptional regulator with XRE-family HTH domain
MRSARVGALLALSRRQRNISQAELARRGDVSKRLVGEFERGARPNVSLETALALLEAAGVSVVLRAADGATAEIRPPNAAAAEREARAAQRRKTWSGGVVPAHSAEDPRVGGSKSRRLGAVTQLSRGAFALAVAGTIAKGEAKGGVKGRQTASTRTAKGKRSTNQHVRR